MKRYLLGLLAVTIATNCTPETEELKVLREEKPASPKNIDAPPVDLSYTIVVFSPSEQQKRINRDPSTKLIGDYSFSFAPTFSKRAIQAGESAVLQIESITSQYERTLPTSSYTIDKAQINSMQSGEEFKVTLKKDAFKDLDITKEYTILLQMKIFSKTPSHFPIKTEDKSDIYRIKLTFTDEEPFPEGDNIEVVDDVQQQNIDRKLYDFESNYQPNHLSKLKDGLFSENWWIDVRRDDIYLIAKFQEDKKLIKGVKITLKSSYYGQPYKIGSVNISASPDEKQYYKQGTYTYDKLRETLIIQFKKPIETKTIKFTNFKAISGNYINIYEMEFF
ncbi:hypothetical protein [Capnocytophaga catalasegens]|uniref:DUF1735 domain-containing protein n=1 Tax=Capnocytophaga catalasegens TaxID=1004260 RepID=A0AAV5AUE2_9FLAO|nr:hypothetical protein [Capnocytophaga catalasegens]GIZ16356.1 hypothetical protein RCZ03_23560 [Capnocytophaga catalasegens]GJM49118.1 hypothetical protein RCZ15_00940 [Capnocytophaga catalasegens]GJM53698.1 hypothetical protein RCZ16_20140 [Capnocytophaga catalasegens]